MTTPPPGGGSTVFQDPHVKILGVVANGPPLAPLSYAGPGPVVYPTTLWGPRPYAASGKLVNFSFRGTLGPAGTDQAMAGGFVVGAGGRVVLLRAVGPALALFGLTNAVARPQLELFDSAGRSMAIAVAWSAASYDTMAELLTATRLVGAFQLSSGSEDQALPAFLPGGACACIVTNRGFQGGVALLEGYEVPNDPLLLSL